MIKARSAFDLGASTPAGANRGSLISVASPSPAHLMEEGGHALRRVGAADPAGDGGQDEGQ